MYHWFSNWTFWVYFHIFSCCFDIAMNLKSQIWLQMLPFILCYDMFKFKITQNAKIAQSCHLLSAVQSEVQRAAWAHRWVCGRCDPWGTVLVLAKILWFLPFCLIKDKASYVCSGNRSNSIDWNYRILPPTEQFDQKHKICYLLFLDAKTKNIDLDGDQLKDIFKKHIYKLVVLLHATCVYVDIL